MVPKLKQKFQSETDVPDVGKVPEITLKPRDGTLSYLLLRSSSLVQPLKTVSLSQKWKIVSYYVAKSKKFLCYVSSHSLWNSSQQKVGIIWFIFAKSCARLARHQSTFLQFWLYSSRRLIINLNSKRNCVHKVLLLSWSVQIQEFFYRKVFLWNLVLTIRQKFRESKASLKSWFHEIFFRWDIS